MKCCLLIAINSIYAIIKLSKTGLYYDRKPLAGWLVVFFYVLFRLTGRLTVFFGNFTIKLFADVVGCYLFRNCKNKIKKQAH
ncbi:hypothetical protein CUS80_13845 [Enterococcus faecium]|nr:hypothetical protein [Enterococcus faecium]PQG42717.1 hypothetical protein CUS80_13845 [Enterococcus faecium]